VVRLNVAAPCYFLSNVYIHKDMLQPLFTLVLAVSENGVIGSQGALPWRLPEDLRRFKAATLGKPILMGRKTFESIGRALPGRKNIILTRDKELKTQDPNVTIVHDLPAVLQAVATLPELMIIGGAEIYALTFPLVQRVLRTRVHANIIGDTYFPELSADEWRLVSSEFFTADDRNNHSMTFELFQRSNLS